MTALDRVQLDHRFRLGTLPTPLVRASRLERALGAGPIWLKRDDLIGFAVAGNKIRSLEFLIADALAERAEMLVTAGSPTSNFCAGAAAAARTAGLACELLFAGQAPDPAPLTVQLAHAAGARLTFAAAPSRADLDDAVLARAAELRAAGQAAYPVPRGGATPIGALGFAYAARELAVQCEDRGLRPEAVVVATGSGGTQAGLVAGTSGFGLPSPVIGASVSRPVHQIRDTVLTIARGCAELLGLPGPRAADIDVRDLVGPGFGLASDEDRHSAELALEHEGLLLDDTYTAKSMTLLRKLTRSGHAGPLVFWHTGGLTAALGSLGSLRPAAQGEYR